MSSPSKSSSNVSLRSAAMSCISIRLAFTLVSFSLGQLGDGLNIFQGVYLVGLGWNEGAVGTALSIMGLTSLLIQPFAGSWVDTTTMDRRWFLVIASAATALSASTILVIRPGHIEDHFLMYASKVVEGLASSFIGPCLAALTLASFGPTDFDKVMASNVYWGHVGSVAAAVLAGLVSFVYYPHIQCCFYVIGASALVAIAFVPYLPQGDPLLGRGLASQPSGDATVTRMDSGMSMSSDEDNSIGSYQNDVIVNESTPLNNSTATAADDASELKVASHMDVFLDYKTCLLCATGFFFHFANANVLLVLGELMGQDKDEDEVVSRSAIPFTAGAIVTAQFTMAAATYLAGRLTDAGVGRKPLFMASILSLPVRCALIIFGQNAGQTFLLSTQILDGIGGGFFGLIHPYIVADITFGTGRFNAVMGLTASAFGLGATLSNFLGQMVVQHFGHTASLMASLMLSVIPVIIFSVMPETLGRRGEGVTNRNSDTVVSLSV